MVLFPSIRQQNNVNNGMNSTNIGTINNNMQSLPPLPTHLMLPPLPTVAPSPLPLLPELPPETTDDTISLANGYHDHSWETQSVVSNYGSVRSIWRTNIYDCVWSERHDPMRSSMPSNTLNNYSIH